MNIPFPGGPANMNMLNYIVVHQHTAAAGRLPPHPDKANYFPGQLLLLKLFLIMAWKPYLEIK
jgi:hypothetical protein